MYEEGYTIGQGERKKGVKIFPGGDMKFMSAMLGHQGQSATCPSVTDLGNHAFWSLFYN